MVNFKISKDIPSKDMNEMGKIIAALDEMAALKEIIFQGDCRIIDLESKLRNMRSVKRLGKCKSVLENIKLDVEFFKVENRRFERLLEKLKNARGQAPSLLGSTPGEVDENTRYAAPLFSSMFSLSSASPISASRPSAPPSSSASPIPSTSPSRNSSATTSDSSAPSSPPKKPEEQSEPKTESPGLDEQLQALIEEGKELDRSQREAGIWE
ncbi:hypothetical protein EAF04_007714 [Stromatinia cepivora]|nr:hypothetical protein EAF04_007714 [Stromatinia cepivora]